MTMKKRLVASLWCHGPPTHLKSTNLWSGKREICGEKSANMKHYSKSESLMRRADKEFILFLLHNKRSGTIDCWKS
jgi:hypothetical protein